MINMQQEKKKKIISNQYTIQNEKEEIIAKPRGKMRQHEAPVVGDFVEYEKIEDSYRIHKVLPRTNRLLRPAIANVDQALIVTSLKDPDYSCHLLNRLIFLVGLAGVKPVICVTKLDLLNQPEEILADLEKYKKAGYEVVSMDILPDERAMLSRRMAEIADENLAELILTTGGTGFSPRDVMPEATEDVMERKVPGIPEAIRAYSMTITKRAMLSRATAGIRKKTLIINLPGSPKAVRESLEYIIDALDHGIEIMTGETGNCAR